MKLKAIIYALLVTVVCVCTPGKAQTSTDTITVMVYNLLNYGVTTSSCNSTNNPAADKRTWLTTIFNYVKPDIVGVNELGNNPILATGLLNLVFNNPSSHATFEQATWLPDNPSTNIVSFLFYNKQKLGLKSAATINTLYRYPKAYELYYNDANLANGGDTIFLRAVVTHQKAGNTASDRTDRQTMAEAIMTYLDQLNRSENRLIMGDFNIYNSLEPSYQTFTNSRDSRTRFIDPINRPGSWSGQSIFADIHTQSTVATGNGCKTGGGLDDRFDFILVNNAIMADSFGLRYIPGSYKALGNDGQRFNKAINSTPANTSVPADVLNALANLSDHLPVVAKFTVKKITSIKPVWHNNAHYAAGFSGDQLTVRSLSGEKGATSIHSLHVRSLDGRTVYQVEGLAHHADEKMIQLTIPGIKPGIYMISMQHKSGLWYHFKVFKN